MTPSWISRIRAHCDRCALVVCVVVVAAAGAWALARSSAGAQLAPVAVLRVDTSQPGNEFAPGAVGISMEAKELTTGRLVVSNPRLVRLMRLLGPSVLRIGGGSVDSSWWTSSGEPPPSWATSTVTPMDLSMLRRLLTATGWRVILGVDLGHFEPARAANEARYARKILGPELAGIEIGNEPDAFGGSKVNLRPPTYDPDEYLREAKDYSKALTAATPGVAIYGPELTEGGRWLIQIGAAARIFAELTQHYYPINKCPNTVPPVPRPTVTELLSPAVREHEDSFLAALAKAKAITSRPTRVDETNSAACGRVDASPAFAGALWSLDWSLRAGDSGVGGLNFHGGVGFCGFNSENQICASSSQAARAGDVTAQPEYYGLLAARQLEGGQFVPVRLIAPSPLPDLTDWATLTPEGTVKIAIDNLDIVGLPQPVSIPTSGYTATEEALTGPSIEANNGILLGGAAVSDEGRWHPVPTQLRSSHGIARVIVDPANAVIVILHRKR